MVFINAEAIFHWERRGLVVINKQTILILILIFDWFFFEQRKRERWHGCGIVSAVGC